MLCGHSHTFYELAGVKLCLCSQAKPDLTPGGSDQTRRDFALFYLLAVSLQVNTSSFPGDPLGTLGENHLGCVLGLEPGITLSRLPAGSLARPWLVVMEPFCPHQCLFKAQVILWGRVISGMNSAITLKC